MTAAQPTEGAAMTEETHDGSGIGEDTSQTSRRR